MSYEEKVVKQLYNNVKNQNLNSFSYQQDFPITINDIIYTSIHIFKFLTFYKIQFVRKTEFYHLPHLTYTNIDLLDVIKGGITLVYSTCLCMYCKTFVNYDASDDYPSCVSCLFKLGMKEKGIDKTETEKCSICQFELFGEKRKRNCHHSFHADCLEKHLGTSWKCPNCRKRMRPSREDEESDEDYIQPFQTVIDEMLRPLVSGVIIRPIVRLSDEIPLQSPREIIRIPISSVKETLNNMTPFLETEMSKVLIQDLFYVYRYSDEFYYISFEPQDDDGENYNYMPINYSLEELRIEGPRWLLSNYPELFYE